MNEETDNELEAIKAEAEALGLDTSGSDNPPIMDYSSPSPAVKDNIFKFFREILHIKDSTRFGNLSDIELGKSRMGVRYYKTIALFADSQGLDLVAQYLMDRAEIVTSTSMSKKGWFGNRPVEDQNASE